METEVPHWFSQAIAVEATPGRAAVGDVELHYRSWGHPEQPGIVLVHGGAAHSHWWDFIAPAFLDRYRVVALDMSGHGESGRRERYPLRTWARELLAVIDAAEFVGKPAIVGHSMGGVVSIVAAALHGERFAGAVIVDAPVRSIEAQKAHRKRITAFGNPHTYPSREAAQRAFRLVPPQPCANDFLVRHIAAHSVREVEGGYTWKFDPGIMRPTVYEPLDMHLAQAKCPTALIVGEHSEVVEPEMVEAMRALAPEAPVVCIHDAYHHVLLDQPQAFTRATRERVDAFFAE